MADLKGYVPEKENPMKRYFGELKQKNGDAVILFRRGSFYEANYEDAKVVADVCGIALNREDGSGGYVTGFPHHALEVYLPKLIRAGLRIAICDDIINPKNEKVMNENIKAADLIGKKITIKGTANYYTVLSVDGDLVNTEFHMGNQAPKNVPLSVKSVENFFANGVWTIEAEEPAKATDEVEEVEDVQPTKPEPKDKAEKPKAEPKPKAAKPKAEKPKADAPKGNYSCVLLPTKDGKQWPKLYGFGGEEEAKAIGAKLAETTNVSWDRDEAGNQRWYIGAGKKYCEAFQTLCDALNSGDQAAISAACKATVDIFKGATANRESKPKAEKPKSEKTYTRKEVEGFIRKAFGSLAEAMNEDAAQFEPIIQAALPEAA